MIARAYMDDSWDGTQSIAVSAGGFVGRFGQWCDLKKKWNRRLKRDGLEYFRSTEYYSLQGEFKRFKDPIRYPKPEGSNAAAALRDDLDRIISGTQVTGMAVCVPLQEYYRIRERPHATTVFPEDAFEFAVQALMITIAQKFKETFAEQHGLAFFCDDGPSSDRIARAYTELKVVNTDSASVMGSLTPVNDKLYPQVQAADLMAHLARESLQKHIHLMKDGIFEGRGQRDVVTRLPRLNDEVYTIKVTDRVYLESVLNHEITRRGLE